MIQKSSKNRHEQIFRKSVNDSSVTIESISHNWVKQTENTKKKSVRTLEIYITKIEFYNNATKTPVLDIIELYISNLAPTPEGSIL